MGSCRCKHGSSRQLNWERKEEIHIVTCGFQVSDREYFIDLSDLDQRVTST